MSDWEREAYERRIQNLKELYEWSRKFNYELGVIAGRMESLRERTESKPAA